MSDTLPYAPTSTYTIPISEVAMRTIRTFLPRPARHRIRIPCQVVRLRDFKLVADSIENLSLGGILVGPSDPVLTGEQVYVSFELPCSGEWIDTDATVARVIHGRREGDHTRQLGVKFEGLRPLARDAVREQIRRCAPVSPFARVGRCCAGSGPDWLRPGSGWVRSAQGNAFVRWWDT